MSEIDADTEGGRTPPREPGGHADGRVSGSLGLPYLEQQTWLKWVAGAT